MSGSPESPPCGSAVCSESSFSLKPGPVCLSVVEQLGSATHRGGVGSGGDWEGVCFQRDLLGIHLERAGGLLPGSLVKSQLKEK